jgi:hypothetical protein
MIRLFLSGLFLNLLLTAAAAAQTVTLRSGEHPDFTRIVLTLPERSAWSLSENRNEAVLNLEGGPYSFDTSSVFKRISGRRLASVKPTGNGSGLTLGLACSCEVSGFWHSEKMLVLDIKEIAASPNRPQPEERRSSSSGSNVGRKANFRSEPSSAAVDLMISSLPVFPEEQPTSLLLEAKAADVREADALKETRDRLVKQLGRAATQGLLTPRSPHDQPNQKLEKPASAAVRHQEEAEPKTAEFDDAKPQINLHAQTSMDQAFLSGLFHSIEPTPETACLSNDLVNVQTWSTDGPFWSQVSTLRSEMTNASDKLDATVLRDLAKLYIYFGFGAEAIQTLNMVSSSELEIRVLNAMANVLEYGASDQSNILQGQLHCEPDVLLWSLLATPTLPEGEQIDTDSALLAFQALPYHLRQYLGPELSGRFRAAGRDNVADQFLKATSRNPQSATPALLVERAISHADKGGHDKAIKSLEDVVATGAEPSAKALVKMVEYKLQTNEPISFEIAQLAEAYAKENSDLPISNELRWAQIMALASSGAFESAFGLLKEFEDKLSTNRPNLVSDVFGLLAENSDDMQFLRHTLSYQAGDVPPPTSAFVANALAERLLDLGFPDIAHEFTLAEVPNNLRRERAVLNAKISLALGQPRKAEVELLGLRGDDVNLLRARARSMAGEHSAAGELYISAQDAKAALREKWLAEEWQDLGESEDPALAQLASVLSGKEAVQADISENSGELAKNRQMLEESVVMRETIQGLLQAKPTPASDVD